jgi:hypothetical protein
MQCLATDPADTRDGVKPRQNPRMGIALTYLARGETMGPKLPPRAFYDLLVYFLRESRSTA